MFWQKTGKQWRCESFAQASKDKTHGLIPTRGISWIKLHTKEGSFHSGTKKNFAVGFVLICGLKYLFILKWEMLRNLKL
jgi:hypothetical protein